MSFQDWVWADPERRERLCKIYNEKFNSVRPREYDGSHITFSGMNPERCPTCEADFDTVLPQLLVLYYAKQNHIEVELDDEDTLGTQISAYIPEIKLVFDFLSKGTQLEKDIGDVTAHLCKQRGIQYVRLGNTQDRVSVCSEIRKGFGKAHIFITSDSDKDIRRVYDYFFEWRKRGL